MSVNIQSRLHQATTIRAGTEAPTLVQHLDAPPYPTAAFTLADLGSKHQLSRLRANARDWYFDNAPLWRIHLWDGTNPLPMAVPILPSHFGDAVVVQDASSFTLTWSNATYGDVTVSGSFASGRLTLTITIVLGAPIAGSYSIHHVQFPYLKIKPYAVATKADMQVILPVVQTKHVRNATTVLASDARMLVGPQIVPEKQDSLPQALFGTMQCGVVQHTSSKSVLLIRGRDTLGRHKEFGTNGDGNNVIFYVRQYPANNLAFGTGFSSSDNISVQITPLAGGWYDAMTELRGRMEAEAMPAMSRGKIKDLADPGGPISTYIRNAPLIMWMHPLNSDASYARALQEVQRVKSYLGRTPVILLYRWHTNNFGDDWPNWNPVLARADTFLANMVTEGCPVFLYNAWHGWGSIAPWFSAAGTPPQNHDAALGTPLDQYLALKLDQTAYVSDWTASGSLGGSHPLHGMPNLDYAAARNHIRDQWKRVKTDGAGRTIHGFYGDAFSNMAFGGQDYRTALAGSKKGPGSSTYHQGARSLLSGMRSDMRALQADFALLSEPVTEHFVDTLEWMSDNYGDLSTAAYSLPLFATVFSEYLPRFDFISYHTLGSDASASGLNRDNRYALARQFHEGKTLMLVWDGSISLLPWVGQVGDSDYAAWQTAVKPTIDWVKTLVDATVAGPTLRRYFRGKRLRPLAGSYDEYLEANGCTVAPIASPLEVNPTNAEVMSSVWQTEELAGNPVAVLITNYHDSAKSFTIAMDGQSHPEIAGGVRYLYSTDPVTGSRTLVKSFFGVFSHTGTIAARSLLVFEITTS